MSDNDFVVIDHTYDPDGDVYEIVVGREVRVPVLGHERTIEDLTIVRDAPTEDDPAVMEPVEVVIPVEGFATEPSVVGYETQYVDVESFKFAGHDDQWHTAGKGKRRKRRAPEHVASVQRRMVRDALDARAVAAEAAGQDLGAEEQAPEEPTTVALPGVGEAL